MRFLIVAQATKSCSRSTAGALSTRGKLTGIDGRFAGTKELIAGHTVIPVKSRAEALEWTKRFPNRVERPGTKKKWDLGALTL
jgi:hypothetical protein